MKTGLDVVIHDPQRCKSWKRTGLVTHAHTTASNGESCAAAIARITKMNVGMELVCLFGPQHGYWQCEPYNMFETAHDSICLLQGDNSVVLPLYSLYGAEREPQAEHLADVDTLVVDLPDIGCRVYTYMTTLAGCLNQAAKLKKKVVLLDRPNPLGLFCKETTSRVEGNLLQPQYHSFVGWFQIPLRHGLTLGELGHFYIKQQKLTVDYEVITVEGLQRASTLEDYAQILPRMASPNMPHARTMAFFPISVLLEGTNISEGRGTTAPFQAIGAPFLDENVLMLALTESFKRLDLTPSIYFRTHRFMPLFDKYKGEVCKGVFLDAHAAEVPQVFAAGIALVAALCLAGKDQFSWRERGYEYNFDHDPIDLILGNDRWKTCFENIRNGKAVDQSFQQLRLELVQAAQESHDFAYNQGILTLYS